MKLNFCVNKIQKFSNYIDNIMETKQKQKTINISNSHVINNMLESDIDNMLKNQDLYDISKTTITKVLNNLKGGYKIWLEQDPTTGIKIFHIDNTYFQSITRYLYGQCRQDIINTIVDDTNYIQLNFNKLDIDAQNTLKIKIGSAIPGLHIMKHTYIGNILHENTLKTIIKKLESYI